MRTSTRTPRLSWFPCFPTEFITSPEFLAMSATARGVYWSLQLYSWNELTQGSGLSANPEFLQRISAATPLEWDSVREQVLAQFELKDGRYYLPWLRDAAEEAADKVRKLKESASAAAEAKNAKIANAKQTDEIDEIRLDKNGRPNGHADEHSYEPSNGQSSAAPASSTSSHLNPSSAVVLPSPNPSPVESSHQKPMGVSPVAISRAVISQPENGTQREEPNPDILLVQERCAELRWKMPSMKHVQEMLEEASAEEICEAMFDYDERLNDDDRLYAEHTFFAEIGGKAVVSVYRKRQAKEAEESQRRHHAIRR